MALMHWRTHGMRHGTWRQAAEYGCVVSVAALDRQYRGNYNTLAKIHHAIRAHGTD